MHANKITCVTILDVVLFFLLTTPLFGQTAESGTNQYEKAQEKTTIEKTAQRVCPLTGGAINKDAYVDYKGQRIYLCCKGCRARFLKDPDNAVQKIKEKGETVEVLDPVTVQPKCPVSGNLIAPAVFTDYNIHRIYFCSDKCKKKFNKKPQKYLKKMVENKEG